MAGDETTIFVPEELKGGGAVKPTIEHVHSEWMGMSGRFWIALVMAIGLICATILVMSGWAKLDTNFSIAVYTAFSATASAAITTYMGQNKVQSSTNQSTTTNEKV